MVRKILASIALIFCTGMLTGAAPSVQLPANSLYGSQAVFLDDSGAKTSLRSFAGAPAIFTFVYTGCKSACPLTVERLRRLKKITSERHPETNFVLVSMDSDHDSPGALREFRKNHDLNDPHWKLLTGDDADIRTLSVLLGYSYQKTGSSENPISHSNRLVLLDSGGAIVSTLDGLNSDVAELAAKIPASP